MRRCLSGLNDITYIAMYTHCTPSSKQPQPPQKYVHPDSSSAISPLILPQEAFLDHSYPNGDRPICKSRSYCCYQYLWYNEFSFSRSVMIDSLAKKSF